MRWLRLFVFLGAFLMFSMEPMIGRLLLPGFGGGFHVWTTSLMFFQTVLFFGYLYAHLGAAKVGRAHLALLAVPLVLLPPAVRLGAEGGVLAIVAELTADFGLPFLALATTGVVAQGWLARSSLPERDSPYFLYAVSNTGSLLALLAYALVIEPLVGLSVQRWAWSAGYLLYLGAAFLAYRATHATTTEARAASVAAEPLDDAPRPSRGQLLYWMLLSALPSAFLMAVTNLIALDAGNVPLVWVFPLALYLGTFVLAFDAPERVPSFVHRLWPVFGVVGIFFFMGADTGGTWSQVVLHLFVLFVVCLAAHAELYASRPKAKHLTLYYLVLSAGGGLGGAFVALGAPVLFTGLAEYPLAIVGLIATVGIAKHRALVAWAKGPGKLGVALIGALLLAMGWRVIDADRSGRSTATRMLEVRRSFYGLWSVLSRPTERGQERDLISGSTRHGRQLLDGALRHEPLSYYHRSGPLGDAMEILRSGGERRLRVGAIGLGVGAAAAYAEPGDVFDFFEIDQAVVDLARAHFTYLADCRGTERTIVGDARLVLAREPEYTGYDLLLVDAFAGDAIPTHLVTREAVELYRERVARGGLVLFHISNRYYDLRPVLGTIARELDAPSALRDARTTPDPDLADPSVYFVMAQDPEALAPFLERGWQHVTADFPHEGPRWTDDHVNTIVTLLPDWR